MTARDSRLRVIYDNGTESNVLLRSLQRALHRDDAGRRITDPEPDRCSLAKLEDGDLASGTIYVLRSKSDHPSVAANRDVLHKIGVTGGDVERRIANARLDPTFLMADVEIVATYKLFQHQPHEAREPHPSHLRSGAARHRDQGSLRKSGHSARMVPRAALRDRRGGRAASRTERSRTYRYDPTTASLVRAVSHRGS